MLMSMTTTMMVLMMSMYLQRSPSSGSESMWDITDDSLGDLDFAYYEVVVEPYTTGAAMYTIQCIK